MPVRDRSERMRRRGDNYRGWRARGARLAGWCEAPGALWRLAARTCPAFVTLGTVQRGPHVRIDRRVVVVYVLDDGAHSDLLGQSLAFSYPGLRMARSPARFNFYWG